MLSEPLRPRRRPRILCTWEGCGVGVSACRRAPQPRKLPRTHRYQLTAKGRRIITALIAACNADVEQLTKMAA